MIELPCLKMLLFSYLFYILLVLRMFTCKWEAKYAISSTVKFHYIGLENGKPGKSAQTFLKEKSTEHLCRDVVSRDICVEDGVPQGS